MWSKEGQPLSCNQLDHIVTPGPHFPRCQLQPTVSMAYENVGLVLQDGLDFQEKLEIQFFNVKCF